MYIREHNLVRRSMDILSKFLLLFLKSCFGTLKLRKEIPFCYKYFLPLITETRWVYQILWYSVLLVDFFFLTILKTLSCLSKIDFFFQVCQK
jgi:hypothetical protein